MGKKAAKKQKVEVPAKTKKAAPVKPPSDSEDDSSSEEEEIQVKPQQKKAVKVQPAKPAESSSEEESSEEETKAPQVTQKKGAVTKPADDDDDSSSEDDSDEEQAKPAKKAAAVTQKKAAVKRPAAANDDDSSEEDSDEDEEPPAKKAAPAAKKATQKKPTPKEDSDDDEDDSSEDDEEEAAPAKKTPAAKAVNGKKAAKEEDSSDEDDSEDDDDDDDEEEEETVKVAETKKRKKEKGKQEPPVKKPKLDASATNGEAAAVTLFVGNLDKSTTEDELSEFFTENGITVAEVRKPPNKNNAFVDLGDNDELETALALSGSTFKENTITVEKAKPRGQKEPRKEQQNRSFGSPGGDDDRDSRTLFVKNLPEDATEDNLGEIFDTAASIRIPQKFGAHKGFGFIEFSDAETMEAAMSEKQGADLNGNSLYLDYLGARSNFKKQRGGPGGRGGDRRGRGNFGGGGGDRRSNSGMRGESKVLFVSNLSYDTDESSLKSVFDGAVSARIPTFPDSGKPRGIAFVDFKSADAAAEAFDSMNGQSIDGRQVRLDFAAERGSGGGGGGFNSRGGGGFSPRGRGGRGGGRGRGGDRGRGRGGGRGGFNKARGGIVQSEGKKTTFDDSD